MFISGASAGMGHSVARHALMQAEVVATDISTDGLDLLSQAGASTSLDVVMQIRSAVL